MPKSGSKRFIISAYFVVLKRLSNLNENVGEVRIKRDARLQLVKDGRALRVVEATKQPTDRDGGRNREEKKEKSLEYSGPEHSPLGLREFISVTCRNKKRKVRDGATEFAWRRATGCDHHIDRSD